MPGRQNFLNNTFFCYTFPCAFFSHYLILTYSFRFHFKWLNNAILSNFTENILIKSQKNKDYSNILLTHTYIRFLLQKNYIITT